MMDKKKARLRVGVLLDTCRDCVKAPKTSVTGSIPVEVREESCGECSTHEELKKLRPILDGKWGGELELNLTAEEFVQLNYVEKKSYNVIAEMKGVDRKRINAFKFNNKEAIQKILKEKGLSEADATIERGRKTAVASPPVPSSEIEFVHTPVAQVINWKAKYEEANALVEDQKVEIKDLLTTIDGLREVLKELQAANDLHAACEDVEIELADIRKENDMLREENARFIELNHRCRVELEKEQQHSKSILTDCISLREENKHLRGLVKLWL